MLLDVAQLPRFLKLSSRAARYSELDEEKLALKDEASGRLTFGAANICNHVFGVPFIREKVTRSGRGWNCCHGA